MAEWRISTHFWMDRNSSGNVYNWKIDFFWDMPLKNVIKLEELEILSESNMICNNKSQNNGSHKL